MAENATFRTWHDVCDRYKAPLAPPGLHLTQALANSTARTQEDVDPLDDPSDALAWITTLADEWAVVHGGPTPRLTLTAADIAAVRRLRSTVHDLLLRKPEATLRTPVEISVGNGQVSLLPKGSGGTWLTSAIGAELLLAQQNDTLRRLKLCREPLCRTCFYDQSNNNSKQWHDTSTCGVRQRMRDYRQRRQQAGQQDQV
ncbi:CGNR zinc finger domain-containing protein [Streptomyces sp. NPDC026672]|uniref:CGNR zinc finger domain-containing protein n=1 Tax=unclassified Streptomyces TaxID=2593676 RepID=UPI0033F70490